MYDATRLINAFTHHASLIPTLMIFFHFLGRGLHDDLRIASENRTAEGNNSNPGIRGFFSESIKRAVGISSAI